MSTVNRKFNSLFAKERKKIGLTQASAAKECSVSTKMWGRYERGENLPSTEVLLGFQQVGANVAAMFAQIKIETSSELGRRELEEQTKYLNGHLNEELILNAYRSGSEEGRDVLLSVARLILKK